MNLLVIVLPSAILLTVAYWTYGPILSRLLKLDRNRKTPAVEMRDELDYVPISPPFLLSQHFSAIAAAGPIVGPIFAGVWFGWAPALIWILVGSIFIGGVHDMAALVASIRHRARSIAEVVREHMSPRSYYLFLAFVWLALVYIVVAFADITSSSFLGVVQLENDQQVSGAGIATSSLLYLAIPMFMGVLLRYTRLSIGWATVIFLPLVGLAIWVGQYIPFDLGYWLNLPDKGNETQFGAQTVWNVLLLVYCFVASIVPVWLLLQPRGHLGGYFLFAALGGGAIGLVIGGETIQYPAFTGWTSPRDEPLFPVLFVTIACGACSGFHSLIASGTTSKQLRNETDARLIGYGTMLMEAMVAIVALCCVMMLPINSPAFSNAAAVKPNYLYAEGVGKFLGAIGIPAAFGVSFGLMAFTTFVYDTLDICTRLGRYIIEELTGWRSRAGRTFATALTAGVPLYLLLAAKPIADKPAYMVFWELFGSSNQLLAALTLIGVTVWLWRTQRAKWVWFVTGIPTVWMYVMSIWALARIINRDLVVPLGETGLWTSNPVPYVALVLVGLALLMLVEAVIVIFRPNTNRPNQGLETAALPAAGG